ncbi:hypothetical protein I7I53_01593 [Histoplasma capsulatum var. duboisii H88]|nr:hypothetical protein I7I53_01593 [Histoplasma capsulatum var. duboisii H88]
MISTAAPPAAASAASASLPLLARRGLADFKQWIQPLIGSSQGVRLGVTRGLQLTARRLGTTHHHPSPPSQKSPPWGGEGEMCGWACFVSSEYTQCTATVFSTPVSVHSYAFEYIIILSLDRKPHEHHPQPTNQPPFI